MEELNLEIIKKEFEKACEFDDSQSAFLLSKKLEEKLSNDSERNVLGNQLKEYFKFLLKFKFLSLNMIEDWDEVIKLISVHFNIIFEIKYYDIWSKVRANLVTISDFKERNNKKMELKSAILNSENLILDEKKYRDKLSFIPTIKNWFNDYNFNLGAGKIDNLKRIQYLTNSENIKKLDEEDRKKIKALFDFYEKIKNPSISREGFENEIPMIVNDKFIIFKEGKAEEISNDIFKIIKSIKTSKEIAEEEKKILTEIKEINPNTSVSNININPRANSISDISNKNLTSTPFISSVISNNEEIKKDSFVGFDVVSIDKLLPAKNSNSEQIEELKKMVEQFSIGSLERKAIEEEIEKIGS